MKIQIVSSLREIRVLLAFVILLFLSSPSFAQGYTRADTLRGSITPERAWWDVTHYNLKVTVNPSEKSIEGSNTITYKVTKPYNIMQIDLQAPMKIDKITQDGQEISFTSEGNAHFLKLQQKQEEGKEYNLTLFFSGKPTIAKRPPWDGGFTWTTDSNGKDFIANSNQGIGASIWWPLKDHPADEPDNGVTITVTAPKDLMDVSNGRLKKVIENAYEVVAIELLTIVQAIEYLKVQDKVSSATGKMYQEIRDLEIFFHRRSRSPTLIKLKSFSFYFL